MSTATQLASVRAAIAAIEAGSQSVRYGDRQATKADLDVLYARERELMARVAAESRATGRNRITYVVPD
jgi:hypothetical protein